MNYSLVCGSPDLSDRKSGFSSVYQKKKKRKLTSIDYLVKISIKLFYIQIYSCEKKTNFLTFF